MGAGLGSLGGGRVRRWGPIEVVWTFVVIAGLAAGAWLAVIGGQAAADDARDYRSASEGPVDSSVWAPMVVGGVHTQAPVQMTTPGLAQLALAPWPVDVRVLDSPSDLGRGFIAEVFTSPPTDGAAAERIVQGVSQVLSPNPGFTFGGPTETELTVRGFQYSGGVRSSVHPEEPWSWFVSTLNGRTYVLAGYMGPMGAWLARTLDALRPVG